MILRLKLLAQLQHENVIPMYEYVSHD